MNRRIPRFLVKFWVLRFSHSQKVWVPLHMLWNFHILTPSKYLRKLTICKLWVNRRTALRDFMKCRNAFHIDNAWRVELGHSIRRFIKLRVPCVSVAWTAELRIDSRALINHPAPSSPCSVMYAWSSHAISRPILIIAELNIHDLKEEELHSNVM